MKFNFTTYGSENPMIYFLEDINHETNMSFRGNFVVSLLNSFGLTKENCRFTSVLRIEDTEENETLDTLYNDIEMTNPKVIVTVGGEATKDIIPNFKQITKNHGKIYDYNNRIVIPVYHPGFLNKQDSVQLRLEFKNEIKKALDLSIGNKTLKDYENEEYNDNTVVCLTYSDFDEFCKNEIDNANLISYDVESNAEEKTSNKYEIVGFSLASRSNMGCYVVLNSLDYKMPEIDKKLVEARLRKILLNKQVLVYNCMHEIQATLTWLHIEILNNIDDLFVMVKLLMGNASKYSGNGGLKIQCQTNLNTKDWSEDLDKFFEYFKNFKKSKDEMLNLMKKYYSDTELDNVMSLLNDLYSKPDTFKNSVLSYGYAPYKLIGKYGGTDSSILFDLKRFYDNKIEEYNKELGIDLRIGYNHWMNHHKAGYILERNGAHWNDEKASELEEWCSTGMLETLNNLICSPLSEPYVKSKLEPIFLNYLKENYIEQILGEYAVPKRLYKSSISITVFPDTNFVNRENPLRKRLQLMSLEPKTKKKKDGTIEVTNEYKLELGHIKTLSKDFLENHPEIYGNWYKEYMDAYYNNNNKTVEEMKQFLNPTATASDFKEFVSSILITDDIIYAKFYLDIIKILDDPNFNITYYTKFDTDYPLLELVTKLNSMDMTKFSKFRIFKKQLNSIDSLKSRKLINCLNDALAYKLNSLSEEVILELYEMYVLCGINIEDRSTWNDRFDWLYNYRFYKKYSKMLTTYVYGRVGRNSVWYVDKKSLELGDRFTPREYQYYDDGVTDTKDKDMILQTNFLVNMADTGRWKATLHTIPAGETVKGIITSRFKGGIIAMPDCSQAEVRVLAAQSKDKNLISAFQKEGTDIHKFVASLVFHNGNIDEVTPTERKIAKGAVFGILYGESEKSFADSFFHSDLDKAQEVFEYFYNSFPGIKDYVQSTHDQFDKYEKVILPMMNRFINMRSFALENGDDKDRVYRQSQNMPIQGQTCDLAGLILYNVCKFIEDNNLKSKVFCFIHDSIEIDIHPDETFLMLDKLKPLFNEYPWDNFKVPMASDIVFSANMGAEIDCVELVHDNEYNDVTITMKGFKDNIDEVIDGWKEVYDLVDEDTTFDCGEPEEVYVPRSGLFQQKVVISKLMGTTRYKIKKRYHIIRKLK